MSDDHFRKLACEKFGISKDELQAWSDNLYQEHSMWEGEHEQKNKEAK